MIKRLADHVVVRFIIAGGTSATVNFAVFFLLYRILKVYYLYSSVIAFVFAFFVSFSLHKIWTFKSQGNRNKQMVMYLFTSLFGLGLNTVLMYMFVDLFHVYPLVSLLLAGGSVAFCSFTLSHKIVFRQKTEKVLEIDIQ